MLTSSFTSVAGLPIDPTEVRSTGGSHPNVIWAEQHSGEDSTRTEAYTVFRKQALDERQAAQSGETPRAMMNLYGFWSHFLIGKFNAKMYSEFRTCAIEDASGENPTKDGLKCLVRYYKKLFSHDAPKPWGHDRPIPEIFTLHYQEALALDPKVGTNGDAAI